jgi:hypothetical protein
VVDGKEVVEHRPPPYPPRISLSPTAEQYLDQLTTDLHLGLVELWQLPSPLRRFYEFAFADGAASQHNDEIARLNAENDRLYLRAYNSPKEVAEIMQRRIQSAFEDIDAQFFSDAKLHNEQEVA